MSEMHVGRQLFKVDSAGRMRTWRVEREGNKHRVVAGLEGGSAVVNEWTVCDSKGIGKAQTTPEEQAIKEVAALYTKQLKRSYYETPDEARGPARNYLPMLANGWKDTTWDKWLARCPAPYAHLGSKAFFQPKLDGFCCIATAAGLQSRKGLPILTAGHIQEALRPFFDEHPDAILHGELYNHDLREEFEQLSSLLRREKNITPEHLNEVAAKVQYHVYDFPGHGEHLGFGERFAALDAKLYGCAKASNGVIHVVDTTPVTSEEHLLELTAAAVEAGYEGGIGRLHLPYEKAKRSWSVIKIKSFDDDEFEVVRIEEGKGNYAGYAKRVICWLPGADRSMGETKDNTFEAGIKGKRDQWLAELLTASHKIVTIRYFGYTMGGEGKPRFGVATHWHGDERVL